MAEHAPLGTFGFAGGNCGEVADAGVDLQSDVGVLEGFVGVGGATDAGFDVVALPAECGVSDLDIEGYASDGGKQKGGAVMVNFPVASGSWLTGLALQQKFYKVWFVGVEH